MALQQSDTPPPLSHQLNWPNKITLVRIFLVPLLLVFLMSPDGWFPLVAALIFLVAAFTDWLVGRQQVPAWMVVIIICRELAITGLRALAADQHIIIAADVFGKYKMVCFIIGSLLLMLNLPILNLPGIVVLAVGMLLSAVSGI